eukprot:TRINITY_DN1550_c1_g1_i1.p1 TRINITY_DN1550_c1_g1~~TRINITY_DN1550_c1_g1_i1.p1  ORF type:complete len:373 (-),score=101.52 TRINITY_DN1550_c1_g1_i1:30-1148(-)
MLRLLKWNSLKISDPRLSQKNIQNTSVLRANSHSPTIFYPVRTKTLSKKLKAEQNRSNAIKIKKTKQETPSFDVEGARRAARLIAKEMEHREQSVVLQFSSGKDLERAKFWLETSGFVQQEPNEVFFSFVRKIGEYNFQLRIFRKDFVEDVDLEAEHVGDEEENPTEGFDPTTNTSYVDINIFDFPKSFQADDVGFLEKKQEELKRKTYAAIADPEKNTWKKPETYIDLRSFVTFQLLVSKQSDPTKNWVIISRVVQMPDETDDQLELLVMRVTGGEEELEMNDNNTAPDMSDAVLDLLEGVIDKETRWFIRFFCTRYRSKRDLQFYKDAKEFFIGFDTSFSDDKLKLVEPLPTPSLPTTKRKVVLPSDRIK